MTKTGSLPLIERAQQHRDRTALRDTNGSYSYAELIEASARVAAMLLNGADDLREQRVCFQVAPGFEWVAVQWGIWRAGGVAVPLPAVCTGPELEYLISDSAASILVSDAGSHATLAPFANRERRVVQLESMRDQAPAEHLPAVEAGRRAMMLYTSGTTSRPKGVVTTHANIAAQITSLVEAWEWTPQDRIVLCLPLHHVHGIVNVLCCALWSGAMCHMLPRFDAAAVWELIANGSLTLFMAVPTIYVRLISAWEAAGPQTQAEWSAACRRLRLMVSGSAALPVSTLHRWQEISGHVLLERYGMTEIGMALSNPLHGRRIPGSVGGPLPGVQVQLTGEDGTPVPEGTVGEIEVRGPNVFLEYWNRPDGTREAFRDGWFRTGDTAVVEEGSYRILGRTNIDILKTGGHKLSALEIEEVLRQHPSISECAVVGVPDEEWGQRVAAGVVLREGHALELPGLREWARQSLAPHKLPSLLLVMDALPRNAMGKVVKPTLAGLFVPEAGKSSR